jgi:GNAT superfamily N-acetyltransferase
MDVRPLRDGDADAAGVSGVDARAEDETVAPDDGETVAPDDCETVAPDDCETVAPDDGEVAPEDDVVGVLHDECWLPFGVEMQELDAYDALADDLDAVREANVAHRRERLESEDAHTVVAVPAAGERRAPELAPAIADPAVSDARTVDAASLDDPATFAGYASAVIGETPPVFARGDHLTVEELYVRPEYRGEGLARTLLDAVEDWGRERGCDRAELHVHVRNERAQAVYERHGYEAFMHKYRHEL